MNASAKQISKLVPRTLYKDRAIVVVNKPSGLVCQSDKTSGRRNAFDKLLLDTKKELHLQSDLFQVHRLDKYTTGTLLLAKGKLHARAISQQFQSHTIKKTYLAIVRGGEKSFPGGAKIGTVRAPLLVTDGKVTVDEVRGSPALTDWELLGSSDSVPLSLVKLSLHSGIKHQLRVHLSKELKTPILGDTVYSRSVPQQEIVRIVPRGSAVTPPHKGHEDVHRVFLHAANISLLRYRTEGSNKQFRLRVTAPVPPDFLFVCKKAGLAQYLTTACIEGGVEIDDEPVLSSTQLDAVQGRWLA